MKRGLIIIALASAACVHGGGAFDRYLAASQWMDASRAFMADSTLLDDERALCRAGILYGTPGRETYRPERADSLFRRLIGRFPGTKHLSEAVERIAVLDALIQERDSAARVTRGLEQRVATLTSSVSALRQQLDSIGPQADSLRRNLARLEAELRDRDEQLRAARLELQRLKEIDLKTRPPTKPPRT